MLNTIRFRDNICDYTVWNVSRNWFTWCVWFCLLEMHAQISSFHFFVSLPFVCSWKLFPLFFNSLVNNWFPTYQRAPMSTSLSDFCYCLLFLEQFSCGAILFSRKNGALLSSISLLYGCIPSSKLPYPSLFSSTTVGSQLYSVS